MSIVSRPVSLYNVTRASIGFEEKRVRWLKRKSRSNSKEQSVKNKNTTKKFLAAHTEAEAQSDSSEAQQVDTVPRSPPQRKRKRTPSPERANTSNILGQIAPKPLFNHVSKQKPVSKLDDEVYTMPTKVFTSQTLKTLPKGLKIKIETARTDSSSVDDVPDRIDSPPVLTHPPSPPAAAPATSLAAPPKPLRVLPKYSKTAQEVREQNRLAQEVVRNDGETTREDTVVRSGMIHVSDTIAQRPQSLYDLIVKTRETTWSIAISQVAYETTVRTHPSVALDYETLRLKEILFVRDMTTEILQMAAQERLLHLGEFDRHVVIADADEQFQYIPSGIEVRSVETFLA